MKKLFFALMICIAVSAMGCASPKQVMVNPESGTIMDCEAGNMVMMGAVMAIAVQEDCVKKYREFGYVRIENYSGKPSKPQPNRPVKSYKLLITSQPSGAEVYWGTNPKDVTTLLSHTPVESQTKKGSGLPPMCYQARVGDEYKGYKTSKIICKPEQFSDRIINFSFK